MSSNSHVTINSVSIDPNGQHKSRDAAKTNYIYLRCTEPLDNAQLQQLNSLGCKINGSIDDDNTYMARYEPHDLQALRDLDFVDVANCYHTSFKVSPEDQAKLHQIHNDHQQQVAMVADSETEPPKPTLHEFNLIMHPTADNGAATKLAQQVANTPGVDPNSIVVTPEVITLKAAASAVQGLKEHDDVETVAFATPMKLFNNLARIDMHVSGAGGGNLSPFGGKGQVVCVNDTGLDLGDVNNVHPAFTNRVLAINCVSGARSGADSDSHGTHVAGSVLGCGESKTMGGAIEGSAPEASLVMQKVLDSDGLFSPPRNLVTLLSGPYNEFNAKVNSNSWGATWNEDIGQIPYNSSIEARSLDYTVSNIPDLVVVVAAGNDGEEPVPATISALAGAKNCITVGATYSSRPTGGRFAYVPGGQVHGPGIISAFSSKGPTVEGRIKPDICAPGVAILSTKTRDPEYTKPARFGPSSDDLYMFDSGTSMATPLVSGCCAVLREMLIAQGTANPSAALIKSLLINGSLSSGETHDDASNAESRPTGTLGWGYVDLAHSLMSRGINDKVGYNDHVGISVKEHADFHLPPPLPTESHPKGLKVTLVWTDPMGSTLQNHLILEVCDYTTNKEQPTVLHSAITGRTPKDNVQQVIAHGLPEGRDLGIRVRCTKITPVQGAMNPQAFAVAWTRNAA